MTKTIEQTINKVLMEDDTGVHNTLQKIQVFLKQSGAKLIKSDKHVQVIFKTFKLTANGNFQKSMIDFHVEPYSAPHDQFSSGKLAYSLSIDKALNWLDRNFPLFREIDESREQYARDLNKLTRMIK